MMIYAELNEALHGNLQAELLFWQNLSKFLIDELGFVKNLYDWCVMKKDINGKQCSIGWCQNFHNKTGFIPLPTGRRRNP